MSLKPRYFAPLLVAAGTTTSIAVAPIAAADAFPLPPVGQSPVDAIEDLEAQGYNVQINWTRGIPDVPLSECTLIAIHDPDGPPNGTLATVYLDISCPPNDFD